MKLPGARSIRDLLKMVFFTIVGFFLITSVITLVYMRQLTLEYNRQIDNIEFANVLSRVAKEEIARESWYIVAGRQSFDESRIYEQIAAIRRDLDTLYANSPGDGRELVEAAMRASDTLVVYVDRLRTQWEGDTPVSYQQATQREISKVSNNIYDVLQDFAYDQINGIARANEELQHTIVGIMFLLVLLNLVAIAIALIAYRVLKDAIERPNQELAALADRILQGDLTTQAHPPGLEELNRLTDSINLMGERIRTLVNRNIEEQKNLQKSELRALQAQITPHFLYNTFDTIVWLAEGGHNAEVVKITLAFSNYYRIALSRGRDFITVGEEVEHVRDYLVIQGIRYEDILRYEIHVEEGILGRQMLKLLLQPIVENALYHGIKNKRGGGKITLTGRLLEDGSLYFAVEDDGRGMEAATLAHLRREIDADRLPEASGYGLYNVNRRLRLFYGNASLNVDSADGQGTKVEFILPPKEVEP